MNLNIKDSPLSICLISMLFISLGYLVYRHPQEFQLFVHIVLIGGFIVLTGLLIASYKPFTRYYQEYINENGKIINIKPHMDYHQQLEQNTKKQLDQLMKSEKYRAYQQQKQQNPHAPVIMCPNKTVEQIEQQAKLFEEKQTEIFQDQPHPLAHEA